MKLSTSLFILASISALSMNCVAQPTPEEQVAFDYGSCPTNYDSKIREYFQSGLIVTYLSEPVIWSPRKYWYKEPWLMGGNTYSGYLVPVTIEQKHRLEPTMNGRQLYGFLFKDNELIKTPGLMQMRNYRISESIGPLPSDERDWKIGHSARNDALSTTEWVLPGETVQNWSELITLQGFYRVPPDFSPEKFARDVAEGHKKDCASVSLNIVTSSRTEALYERTSTNCASNHVEFDIGKYILGPRTVSSIFYSRRSESTEIEKRKWIDIINKVELMNECQK